MLFGGRGSSGSRVAESNPKRLQLPIAPPLDQLETMTAPSSSPLPRDSLRPKTITKIFDETGKGTRRPTEVQIAVEVSHCWDLNIRTESFCIEFSVYSKWKANADEGDAIMEASGGDENESWTPEWFPRIKVHHMKEEKSDDAQDFQAYRTKETGEVVWIEGMKSFSVSICESYDVEAFPFDIQWLELKGAPAGLHPDLFAAASSMESRWSPFGVAASVPPSSAVEITNAIKIVPMDYPPDPKAWGGGYKAPVLVNELGVSTLPDYNLSRDLPASYKFEEGSSRVESSVSVVLLYDRAYRYHVYNSYGVLCGIGTVCIAIWCLPIMEMGSRLSLDVTLLLVAVAFKQVLSAELPPVSYLTILDYYALTTILFVFVATWLHALVGNLADQGVADETIYLIDQCAVVLYATFFALYNLWHLCYVHTQLFANELMTDKKQLTVHGYLPAQIGTIGVDGNKVASARDGSSIFGKFADRPTTVQPNEVVGVMALLLSGFSRAEAMDKMEAKMAEAKAQMENDAIHVQRSDDDYQTLTEHES